VVHKGGGKGGEERRVRHLRLLIDAKEGGAGKGGHDRVKIVKHVDGGERYGGKDGRIV